MGFFRAILSKIAGRKPSVNQMTVDSLAWNERDGKLYGLKIDENGVKSVVPIGGGDGGWPAGGTTGQVPTKASDADGDVIWADPQGGDVSLLLDVATATFAGFTGNFVAGENLVKGNFCYMSQASGKMVKADADALASSYCIAVATDVIAADATGEFLLIGIIGGFEALTIGAPVYLSVTTGTLQQASVTGSNDVVQFLGMAISETHIYFKPEIVQLELL